MKKLDKKFIGDVLVGSILVFVVYSALELTKRTYVKITNSEPTITVQCNTETLKIKATSYDLPRTVEFKPSDKQMIVFEYPPYCNITKVNNNETVS